MALFKQSLYQYFSLTDCNDGQVRLEGGDHVSFGHVQLCVNETWRGVCGDGWDMNDTEVVCRQLHYNHGGIPKQLAIYEKLVLTYKSLLEK